MNCWKGCVPVILLGALLMPSSTIASPLKPTEDDANVSIMYTAINHEQPLIRRTTTSVHIGLNKWTRVYHNARLVTNWQTGCKRLVLLKSQRLISAQVGYVELDDRRTYEPTSWDGIGCLPIRSTARSGGKIHRTKVNFVAVLIYTPNRPVPPQLVQPGQSITSYRAQGSGESPTPQRLHFLPKF